ncbi:hypothetical protein EV363DRAFT_1301075 [Boletus edulis]|nr:hypothetical protein EV363DRAFT_1301075 [Boletus edulis]
MTMGTHDGVRPPFGLVSFGKVAPFTKVASAYQVLHPRAGPKPTGSTRIGNSEPDSPPIILRIVHAASATQFYLSGHKPLGSQHFRNIDAEYLYGMCTAVVVVRSKVSVNLELSHAIPVPMLALRGTMIYLVYQESHNGGRIRGSVPEQQMQIETCLVALAHDDSKSIGFVSDTSRYLCTVLALSHSEMQHALQIRPRCMGQAWAWGTDGEPAPWDLAKIIAHAEFITVTVPVGHRRSPRCFSSPSWSLIPRNTVHTGPARGLDFNLIQTSLLSFGAVSGEVTHPSGGYDAERPH